MTPDAKMTVIDQNGRKCVSTGSPWEPVVAFSRALREGDFITVHGFLSSSGTGCFARK
jgi:hypothetical protein